MKKRLFILASSYKHYPKRCVAGHEVVLDEKGQICWGGWVRPVTNHDEGALNLTEFCYDNGKYPKPLDVVDISVTGPEQSILQPDNWFIDPGQRWKKVGEWGIETAARLIEQPQNLWLESGQKTDRVSPGFLRNIKPCHSLYLIKPDSFHLKIETKTWDGQSKKRLRGVIEYRGQGYDMGITDPLIEKKYCPEFLNMDDGIVSVKHDGQILLCLSLTPEFQTLHYKVIAAVLELMP